MAESRVAKPRLLLTGGSGFLATNWACAMRDSWDVVLGTHRHRVTLDGVRAEAVSIADEGDFGRALDRLAPDLVIHTAGLTDVDRCELDPALALASNAILARTVASAAAARGIALVHISTDHLFTGTNPQVAESEPVSPMNEYARTKLLAEEWVAEACPSALIVRTNFFGWGHASRRSFSDWLIYTLRTRTSLSAFHDVHFTPILADSVVGWVHALVALGASGVYHVCGDERMSKYDFALRLARVFELPVDLIRRASIEEAHLRAPRPKDMSLDNGRARRAVGRAARSLEDDLADLRVQELEGRRELLLGAVAG